MSGRGVVVAAGQGGRRALGAVHPPHCCGVALLCALLRHHLRTWTLCRHLRTWTLCRQAPAGCHCCSASYLCCCSRLQRGCCCRPSLVPSPPPPAPPASHPQCTVGVRYSTVQYCTIQLTACRRMVDSGRVLGSVWLGGGGKGSRLQLGVRGFSLVGGGRHYRLWF